MARNGLHMFFREQYHSLDDPISPKGGPISDDFYDEPGSKDASTAPDAEAEDDERVDDSDSDSGDDLLNTIPPDELLTEDECRDLSIQIRHLVDQGSKNAFANVSGPEYLQVRAYEARYQNAWQNAAASYFFGPSQHGNRKIDKIHSIAFGTILMNAHPVRKMDDSIKNSDPRALPSYAGTVLDKIGPVMFYGVFDNQAFGFAIHTYSKRGLEAFTAKRLRLGLHIVLINDGDDYPTFPGIKDLRVLRLCGKKMKTPCIMEIIEVKIYVTKHTKSTPSRLHPDDHEKMYAYKKIYPEDVAALVGAGTTSKAQRTAPPPALGRSAHCEGKPGAGARVSAKVPALTEVEPSSQCMAGAHEQARTSAPKISINDQSQIKSSVIVADGTHNDTIINNYVNQDATSDRQPAKEAVELFPNGPAMKRRMGSDRDCHDSVLKAQSRASQADTKPHRGALTSAVSGIRNIGRDVGKSVKRKFEDGREGFGKAGSKVPLPVEKMMGQEAIGGAESGEQARERPAKMGKHEIQYPSRGDW